MDFKAACDAILMVSNSSGEIITDIANQFGVSRGWIHRWVYPDRYQNLNDIYAIDYMAANALVFKMFPRQCYPLECFL